MMDIGITAGTRWGWLALGLMAWSHAAGANPSDPPPPVERYVLIVANNRSQDPALESLRYADDDGLLYRRLFGAYAERVLLLADLDDDTQARFPNAAALTQSPTRAGVHAALTHLFTEMRASSLGAEARRDFFFVFVGHGGMDDEGRGYMHLSDGVFSRTDLFDAVIGASPASFTHLIIDACHAYSMVAGRGEGEEGVPPPTPFEEFLTGNDLEDFPRAGVLVATSDDRETHEWSRIRAGVFSHQVRSGLSGAADVNHDGLIEYSELAAFVGSANAGLAGVGKRVSTFAWAPARDRRASLVDLRRGTGMRHVVVEAALPGRFFVETAQGVRWAEFHKPWREGVVVAVPAGETVYLRDGSHEASIEPGTEAVRVSEPLSEPMTVSERGAVDQAFDAGLFAMPFNLAYYRGYINARPGLLPAAENPTPFLVAHLEGPGQVAIYVAPAPTWTLGAGYQMANALLRTDRKRSHGAYLRLSRRNGSRFEVSVGADLDYAQVQKQDGVDLIRLGVFGGGAFRQEMGPYVAFLAGLDLGFSLVVLSRDGGTDGSVPGFRIRLGAEWIWPEVASVTFGGFLGGHLMTVDQQERFPVVPGFFTGVRW